MSGDRRRERVLSIVSAIVVTLVSLAALEIVLRIADFRELRETLSELTLGVDWDVDLGWAPKVDMPTALKRIFDAYRGQVAEARGLVE